jgi:hypothetical protein
MASKIKVDQLETADGTGTIALQNQLSGMTTASVPTLDYTKMPSNSVIQVVETNSSLTSALASNTNAWVDTGFITGTITPLNTGSKIYVRFDGFIPHANAANGNYGIRWKIYRSVAGGTYSEVTDSAADGGVHQAGSSSGHWIDFNGTTGAVDTPSYTSGQSISYKVYYRKHSSNTNHGYFHHTGGVVQSGSARARCMMMEIKG